MKTAEKRSSDRGQRGFSLVELLVVVVILGILVGMGATVYSYRTGQIRAAVDEANVRTLNSVTMMFGSKLGVPARDVFDLQLSDREKQQQLVAAGFLNAVIEPQQTAVSIVWDPASGLWALAAAGDWDGGEVPPVASRGAWDPTAAYETGDTVSYQGAIFAAHYWNLGQEPGILYHPWQELTPEWRNFNIYHGGAIVIHSGVTYRARWWNRNELPSTAEVWEVMN